MNINSIEKGEHVFDINHGWGIVNNIYVYKFQLKKVSVTFTSGSTFDYDANGRLYVHQFQPTISYHEYKATPPTEYRVGKRVYDINYGWGEITEVSTAKRNKTPVRVRYDEHNVGYSLEGKRFAFQYAPSLSSREYHIEDRNFLDTLIPLTHMEAPIDDAGKNPEPVTPKTFGSPAPSSAGEHSRHDKLVDSIIAITIGGLFILLWYAVFK